MQSTSLTLIDLHKLAAEIEQSVQQKQNGACGFHTTLHSQEFSQFLPFSNPGVGRPHRLTKRRFLK